MRIKKKVTANEAILIDTNATAGMPTPACKYDDAVALIKGAIDNLSLIATDDEIARDSIANLSVVLLDLKGNC